jgi:hypothetical protein
MNWWLIAVLVLIGFLFFKYKENRHKFGLIAIILLLLFLVLSFGQLYFSNNMDLSTFDGIVSAGKVYVAWLGGAAGNVANIGGYAIKQDWQTNTTAVKNISSGVKGK